METAKRRDAILKQISASKRPLSAGTLAEQFKVSRQIIVGDVALLRAAQHPIIATPRGYILNTFEEAHHYTIACEHDFNDTEKELQIIVDCGGKIDDVIVSHPVYGQLSARLDIASRLDIQQFMEKMESTGAKNLSAISDGIHLHTIDCKDESTYQQIIKQLKNEGLLYQND